MTPEVVDVISLCTKNPAPFFPYMDVLDKYTVEFHLEAFEHMAKTLSGYTDTCIISFIDLYQKVKRNFPEVKEVLPEDRITLAKEMVRIGKMYGILIKSCAEGTELAGWANKLILRR